MSENTIIKRKCKPNKCEKCGGAVLRVVYGFPTREAFREVEAGNLLLGGCCIPAGIDSIADWRCKECGQRYRKDDTQQID